MTSILIPPVIWLASIVLMSALHVTTPIAGWLPTPYNWFGLALLGMGLGLAGWHARLFHRLGTNINTFGEPGELTTEGMFRWSRNPMYVGMLISLIGISCMLGSLSPVAGPISFFLLAHFWYIPIEERAMTIKFGEKYLAYQRTVPRWL